MTKRDRAAGQAGPRILLIYDAAFPFVLGGGQRRFYEVGRRLAVQAWTVDWLTFQHWRGTATTVRDGITYRGMGRMPRLYNQQGRRTRREPAIFLLRTLWRLPSIRHYDIVWVAQWPLLHIVPLAIACRVLGVRLVIDWWEVWPLATWRSYSRTAGWAGYALQKLYLKFGSASASLVTDTGIEAARIRAITGRPGVAVIPNGVPLEEIGEVDLNAPAAYDLGCLVRLKDHKRVDLVVEAVHALRERHGITATAAIIGDGPERAGLEALARRLGVDTQVTFFGYIESPHDAYAILKQAKVCMVTTVGGGAGSLAILEGYGCGLPVICFRADIGIDPALIEDGRTGRLVDTVSGEALADAIAPILTDAALLREMRESARAAALHLGWDEVSASYRAVFENALASAHPHR